VTQLYVIRGNGDAAPARDGDRARSLSPPRDRDLLGTPNQTVVDERSTLAETVALMLA
jgi:hypothetical protein